MLYVTMLDVLCTYPEMLRPYGKVYAYIAHACIL